jgi:hypothetical protein
MAILRLISPFVEESPQFASLGGGSFLVDEVKPIPGTYR